MGADVDSFILTSQAPGRWRAGRIPRPGSTGSVRVGARPFLVVGTLADEAPLSLSSPRGGSWGGRGERSRLATWFLEEAPWTGSQGVK